MSEPRTEAGKRLLAGMADVADEWGVSGLDRQPLLALVVEHILAIEAEAATSPAPASLVVKADAELYARTHPPADWPGFTVKHEPVRRPDPDPLAAYEVEHDWLAASPSPVPASLVGVDRLAALDVLDGLATAVIRMKLAIPARLGPPTLPAEFFHALGDVNQWLDKNDTVQSRAALAASEPPTDEWTDEDTARAERLREERGSL